MSFLEDYKYLYNRMIETTPSICGLDEILSPFDYECYKKTSPIGKLI